MLCIFRKNFITISMPNNFMFKHESSIFSCPCCVILLILVASHDSFLLEEFCDSLFESEGKSS
jgi:hypothetical protein